MRFAIAGATIAFGLSGCAALTMDSVQDVEFISAPAGARVSTGGYGSCVTPCTLTLTKQQRYEAQLELPGYETETVYLDPQYKRWGVLATAFSPAAWVDDGTQSNQSFYLDPVRVSLRPGQSKAGFNPAYPNSRVIGGRGPNTIEASFAEPFVMRAVDGRVVPMGTAPRRDRFCLVKNCEQSPAR